MPLPSVRFLILATSVLACQAVDDPSSEPRDPLPGLQAVADEHLHHLITTGGRIWSGAVPEGDAAFAALTERGIRTVVCVDGARPDVEAAERHGLRYIHVPIGYDGIDAPAAMQIAAVMERTDGPVYFHCHHGKHRGPAAAALALRIETGCSVEAAYALMELADTDPIYEGLWRDVAGPLPYLDPAAPPILRPVAEVADFTAAMAQLDRDWDRVKALRTAGWRAPADHPDLAPAKEARILAETLAAARALAPEGLAAEEAFARRIRAAGDDALALATALERGDAQAADASYERLKRGCLGCHDEYRQ